MPKYRTPFPYDITRTIKASAQGVDTLTRTAKGSEEYAYTPAWTSISTAGSINNGELLGFYRRVGSAVYFRVQLTWGSTTTAPGSFFILSLPIPPDGTQADYVGHSLALDVSGPSGYAGTCLITTEDGNNPEGRVYAWAGSNTGRISSTIPFAWTTGDIWRVSGWYTVLEDDIEIPE